MAVTAVNTARELVTASLRLARKVATGVDATQSEIDIAVAELNRMVKGWQNSAPLHWTASRQTVNLVVGQAEYTLNPVRPVQIQNCRMVRAGLETPMWSMSRGEYDDLPNKLSSGTPTSYYYDKQREDARFYVWPVLNAGTGTIEITHWREIEDMDADGVVDFPGEWYDAAVYNLAVRMHMQFPTRGVSQVDLKEIAAQTLFDAKTADGEESVFFGEVG